MIIWNEWVVQINGCVHQCQYQQQQVVGVDPMVESFKLGMASAFLFRVGTMRAIKWPVLSRPWRIIPEMVFGGLLVSLFDYSRRVSLENAMKRQQMYEIAELMRKNENNYGSNTQ